MGDDEAEDKGKKKEWMRTTATHLNFICAFNAFPGKKPGGLNQSIIFDAVQRCDSDRARQLLMVEGKVNATNTSGSSLAHVAVRTGDWKMLDLVLSFHPDVNVKEGKEVGGGTPLHAATAAGSERMVRMLLKNHGDPSIVDEYGSTPLHLCAKKGYAEIAETLINHALANKILGPNLEPLGEMVDKVCLC